MHAADENWRPISGYEGRYEASDLGRVRSVAGKHGGRILAQPLTPLGRHKVMLYSPQTKRARTMLVHRLVLQAFVGPCPDGMEGCHNDGNPDNNQLRNLRWDSHVNNLADRKQHGTLVVGERHHNSRFTCADVRQIRSLAGERVPQREIARRFGTKQSVISNIVRRLTWAHI